MNNNRVSANTLPILVIGAIFTNSSLDNFRNDHQIFRQPGSLNSSISFVRSNSSFYKSEVNAAAHQIVPNEIELELGRIFHDLETKSKTHTLDREIEKAVGDFFYKML